jgi:hypothetical protein
MNKSDNSENSYKLEKREKTETYEKEKVKLSIKFRTTIDFILKETERKKNKLQEIKMISESSHSKIMGVSKELSKKINYFIGKIDDLNDLFVLIMTEEFLLSEETKKILISMWRKMSTLNELGYYNKIKDEETIKNINMLDEITEIEMQMIEEKIKIYEESKDLTEKKYTEYSCYKKRAFIKFWMFDLVVSEILNKRKEIFEIFDRLINRIKYRSERESEYSIYAYYLAMIDNIENKHTVYNLLIKNMEKRQKIQTNRKKYVVINDCKIINNNSTREHTMTLGEGVSLYGIECEDNKYVQITDINILFCTDIEHYVEKKNIIRNEKENEKRNEKIDQEIKKEIKKEMIEYQKIINTRRVGCCYKCKKIFSYGTIKKYNMLCLRCYKKTFNITNREIIWKSKYNKCKTGECEICYNEINKDNFECRYKIQIKEGGREEINNVMTICYYCKDHK